MEESLLELGTMLMIAGMGTVFVFLTATAVRHFQPAVTNDEVTYEEVAAIAAAIRRHRQS